jgi:uncharacterized protein with PIN domain
VSNTKTFQAALILDSILREFLAPKAPKDKIIQTVSADATIKSALEAAGIAHTEVSKVYVDDKEASLGAFVKPADTVKAYGYKQMLLPRQSLRFAVDCNMAKAVTYLRMLGYSCFYENNIADARLADIARDDDRIVLSRDKRLFMRSKITKGRFVRSVKAHAQLKELVDFFGLTRYMEPFSRCVVCDTVLRRVAKKSIAHRLPPKIERSYSEFKYCENCDKVYWAGTHYKDMMRVIAGL